MARGARLGSFGLVLAVLWCSNVLVASVTTTNGYTCTSTCSSTSGVGYTCTVAPYSTNWVGYATCPAYATGGGYSSCYDWCGYYWALGGTTICTLSAGSNCTNGAGAGLQTTAYTRCNDQSGAAATSPSTQCPPAPPTVVSSCTATCSPPPPALPATSAGTLFFNGGTCSSGNICLQSCMYQSLAFVGNATSATLALAGTTMPSCSCPTLRLQANASGFPLMATPSAAGMWNASTATFGATAPSVLGLPQFSLSVCGASAGGGCCTSTYFVSAGAVLQQLPSMYGNTTAATHILSDCGTATPAAPILNISCPGNGVVSIKSYAGQPAEAYLAGGFGATSAQVQQGITSSGPAGTNFSLNSQFSVITVRGVSNGVVRQTQSFPGEVDAEGTIPSLLGSISPFTPGQCSMPNMTVVTLCGAATNVSALLATQCNGRRWCAVNYNLVATPAMLAWPGGCASNTVYASWTCASPELGASASACGTTTCVDLGAPTAQLSARNISTLGAFKVACTSSKCIGCAPLSCPLAPSPPPPPLPPSPPPQAAQPLSLLPTACPVTPVTNLSCYSGSTYAAGTLTAAGYLAAVAAGSSLNTRPTPLQSAVNGACVAVTFVCNNLTATAFSGACKNVTAMYGSIITRYAALPTTVVACNSTLATWGVGNPSVLSFSVCVTANCNAPAAYVAAPTCSAGVALGASLGTTPVTVGQALEQPLSAAC